MELLLGRAELLLEPVFDEASSPVVPDTALPLHPAADSRPGSLALSRTAAVSRQVSSSSPAPDTLRQGPFSLQGAQEEVLP